MGMQPQRESRYHESVVKALRKQYSAEKAKPKKRKQFTLASGKVVLEGSPEYRKLTKGMSWDMLNPTIEDFLTPRQIEARETRRKQKKK
tara:strand:- start:1428 stop:1694 length:267 start_codon:yes stop_codon:yes gene_type:complete